MGNFCPQTFVSIFKFSSLGWRLEGVMNNLYSFYLIFYNYLTILLMKFLFYKFLNIVFLFISIYINFLTIIPLVVFILV